VRTTVTETRVVQTPSIFPIRKLIIRAVRAARLINKKPLSKPDPYIKALFNGNYQRSVTLKSTYDPKFQHDFEFMNVDKIDTITFQVYDDCQISKDDFLGEVRISGTDCIHKGLVKEYELRSREYRNDKVHGTLTLEFKF
jgi:Ca2+-dependent lipid-binding protein